MELSGQTSCRSTTYIMRYDFFLEIVQNSEHTVVKNAQLFVYCSKCDETKF